jgi:hypothetical protein
MISQARDEEGNREGEAERTPGAGVGGLRVSVAGDGGHEGEEEAVQILQLRQARGGQTEQEVSLVFSGEQEECPEELVRKYEGKREKQKNPWPRKNVAWGSWIIARLGGWKGYASQRPPG